MGSGTCNNEQKVTGITATPITDAGNPAPIDGALKITVQSGDGTFAQDPTRPLAFDAISGSALADTVYLVTADADTGPGIKTIQTTYTLTVTSAQASNFGAFSGGTVVSKTGAPA